MNSPGMPRPRLGVSLVLGAVLALAPAAAAAAGPTGPSLSGNVTEIPDPAVFYASAPGAVPGPSLQPPAGARYYIVRGTSDAFGSYHYPVTLQTSDGAPAVVRELSIDQVSHRELVLVGTVTTAQIQSTMAQSTTSVTGHGSSGAATTSGAGVSPMFASPGYSSHYMYTRWYDPIDITLSSAYDEADVWWNASAQMSNWAWNYSLYWDTGNQWRLTANNSYAQILPNNSGLASISYASMRTSSALPPGCGTTTTYYSPNEIYTYVGGSDRYYVDTWATSGCLYLINWEYYVA